jgi:hypothetical protein
MNRAASPTDSSSYFFIYESSSSHREQRSDESCPICLDPIRPSLLHRIHYFFNGKREYFSHPDALGHRVHRIHAICLGKLILANQSEDNSISCPKCRERIHFIIPDFERLKRLATPPRLIIRVHDLSICGIRYLPQVNRDDNDSSDDSSSSDVSFDWIERWRSLMNVDDVEVIFQ